MRTGRGGLPSPTQARPFPDMLRQFRHDPRRSRAVRFHLQDRSRRQTRVPFVALFDVDRGPADQSFFLPAKIKIPPAPNRANQQKQSEKEPEQQSDECSLRSVDGFFHGMTKSVGEFT